MKKKLISLERNYLTEVIYYNDDKTQEYVIRYDGNIKPTFITDDRRNSLYFKDYLSHTSLYNKSNKNAYLRYINTGYEPIYPSLDYCSIKKIANLSYDKIPEVYISEHETDLKPFNKFEYSWFNNSKYIVLDDNIKFTVKNEKSNFGIYKPIETIINECIQNYYNTKEPKRINYILSHYNIEYDWEYYSNTNVDDYVYTIIFKLK